MTLTESELKSGISAGRLDRFYFLYGKETFLVKSYADKIVKKAVGSEPYDFNLVRLDGLSDLTLFSEYVEGLPVFADYKAVVVHDPDVENMLKEDFEGLITILSDIPDTTVIVFYTTNVEYDAKKLPAKLTKFLKEADKFGSVCFLDVMKQSELANLAVKKAAKGGVVFDRADAEYLADRVGGNMKLMSDETAKLMTYCSVGGRIDREAIDKLVPKQLDAEIYDLAAAINAGQKSEAFRVIDELYTNRESPEHIMMALSGTFIDYYRCKLAKSAGMSPKQASESFGYGNRSWILGKIFPNVARLTVGYLRETIEILAEADMRLKSTTCDSRTVIEQAVTDLFICREKRL